METNKKNKYMIIDVDALADVLTIEAVRQETKGECDNVDPNSPQGEACARLAHNLKDMYLELIEMHKIGDYGE